MKIEIDMGATAASGAVPAPAMLDLEELLATRLLVQGNSGSGKSHLLRRLLEQSAAHVQQVVIDPEGDFVGLAERFGHVVIDGDRSVGELETIAARVRQHRISAVLTLETLDAEMQMRAAAVFLNALFDADRDHWFPALIVGRRGAALRPRGFGRRLSEEARKLSLGAMTNLMCRRRRKRGLAGVIATQRLAKLAKNVAAEATNFLMGPHLPRHRHGARRRPARAGAPSGGGVPRTAARAFRGARPRAVAPPASHPGRRRRDGAARRHAEADPPPRPRGRTTRATSSWRPCPSGPARATAAERRAAVPPAPSVQPAPGGDRAQTGRRPRRPRTHPPCRPGNASGP